MGAIGEHLAGTHGAPPNRMRPALPGATARLAMLPLNGSRSAQNGPVSGSVPPEKREMLAVRAEGPCGDADSQELISVARISGRCARPLESICEKGPRRGWRQRQYRLVAPAVLSGVVLPIDPRPTRTCSWLSCLLVVGGLQACAQRARRYPPPSPPPAPPVAAPPAPATAQPAAPVAPVATASTPPPQPIPEHVFEPARRYVKDTDLALYSYHTTRIGNAEGYLAPIVRTSDGGFVVVGTRRPPGKYRVGVSRPVVAKLDASGKKQWEKDYKAPGFLDYEAASAVELPDGYIVYILSYVHPARGSVTRLVRLDRGGGKVWDTRLRGEGRDHTPFPQDVRLVGNALTLEGHIYKDASDTAYGWRGTVSLDGKVLTDEVGGPNPYK